MKINCSLNGKAISKKDAKISIFDNSLFYADGLFETFLAIEDRVVFIEDHLDRLYRGAELIGITIPYSRKTIQRWINEANCKNSASIKKLRLTITSGDSAFWAGKRSHPRVIVIVTEFTPFKKPFRLTVAPFRVDSKSPFRNVKTLSFIIEMTSRKRAYASKYDDGILLNRQGNVAETTSANIFWIKNGRLFTTPLTAGCLEGMTRKHILEIAQENGIPISIKNIKLGNLVKSDEIFIASSLKLIVPVSSITDKDTIEFPTGPLTKRLKKLLLNSIK
ncbi:MAG: aminotransferase class IV [Candidatus Zixiibacteriota bacterium]